MTPLSVQFAIHLVLLELRTDSVLMGAKTACSFRKAENSTGTSRGCKVDHVPDLRLGYSNLNFQSGSIRGVVENNSLTEPTLILEAKRLRPS